MQLLKMTSKNYEWLRANTFIAGGVTYPLHGETVRVEFRTMNKVHSLTKVQQTYVTVNEKYQVSHSFNTLADAEAWATVTAIDELVTQ